MEIESYSEDVKKLEAELASAELDFEREKETERGETRLYNQQLLHSFLRPQVQASRTRNSNSAVEKGKAIRFYKLRCESVMIS